ncbi:MAG: protein phosphatase 2C domain-containing protein [Tetrasphaera sp.]|nr:protein phosphatase 2C domain-containing protein [Tetrasphaera sp.]
MKRPGTSHWDIAAATALGAGHTRSGQPNQDAHQVSELPTGDVVVAVADGHGGKGYVRSDVGSRLAVSIAIDELTRIANGEPEPLDYLPTRIVQRWRGEVMGDVRDRPLTAAEVTRATPATLADPFQLYGATLLIAWLGRHGLWAAQIGDGDIQVFSEGRCVSPIPDDERLVGNLTTSLCGPDAAADFRFGSLPDVAPGDLVLLATDGYGNSFVSPEWASEVMPDLAENIDRHGITLVREQLPSWVEQSAAMGGDDTTVVVVRRRALPAAVPGAGDTVVATVVRPTGPEPNRPARQPIPTSRPAAAAPTTGSRRSRGRRVAPALVAGIVGLAGVGYAATRLSSGSDQVSVPTSSTTSGPSVTTSSRPATTSTRTPTASIEPATGGSFTDGSFTGGSFTTTGPTTTGSTTTGSTTTGTTTTGTTTTGTTSSGEPTTSATTTGAATCPDSVFVQPLAPTPAGFGVFALLPAGVALTQLGDAWNRQASCANR